MEDPHEVVNVMRTSVRIRNLTSMIGVFTIDN